MKILHIGKSLPDTRVERTMLSDIERGDNPFVIIYTQNNDDPIFKDFIKNNMIFKISFGYSQHFGFKYKETFEQVLDIIKQVDPDVLHVHDIYNAGMVMKMESKGLLELPWIYNDHDLWGLNIQYRNPIKNLKSMTYWKRSIGWRLRKWKIKGWEKKIFQDTPVIGVSTLSQKRMDQMQGYTGNSFIMRNFPNRHEIKHINSKEKLPDSIATIGNVTQRLAYYRDTTGFLQNANLGKNQITVIGDRNLYQNKNYKQFSTMNLKVTDNIPHLDIFQHLEDSKYAAIPFIPHPFQSYGDPNKAYLYSHAGCIIIGPKYYCLPTPYFLGYSNMNEIRSLIMSNSIDATPHEIKHHARSNLMWEKQNVQLNQAMQAMKNFH